MKLADIFKKTATLNMLNMLNDLRETMNEKRKRR